MYNCQLSPEKKTQAGTVHKKPSEFQEFENSYLVWK